jgi:hypothetical protein
MGEATEDEIFMLILGGLDGTNSVFALRTEKIHGKT